MPDLITLNETWLKPSITDNEILPSDLYKFFESTDLHSPILLIKLILKDLKTNGGGVLIGVKNALNLNPKIVNYSCKAEVISLELTLQIERKYAYQLFTEWWATLGQENFSQLQYYYNSIVSSNKYKHVYLIGDF